MAPAWGNGDSGGSLSLVALRQNKRTIGSRERGSVRRMELTGVWCIAVAIEGIERNKWNGYFTLGIKSLFYGPPPPPTLCATQTQLFSMREIEGKRAVIKESLCVKMAWHARGGRRRGGRDDDRSDRQQRREAIGRPHLRSLA